MLKKQQRGYKRYRVTFPITVEVKARTAMEAENIALKRVVKYAENHGIADLLEWLPPTAKELK